jgi:hypothetical protein
MDGDAVVDAAALRSLLTALAGPLGLERDPAVQGAVDDGAVVEQIELLERVKAAAAARQARLSVVFDVSQRARQRARGVPARSVGKGVAEQIALARRQSPTAGARHLRVARALVGEMPRTLAALSSGLVSEWTAMLAVRETGCLSAEHRAQVDAELGDQLPTLTPARAAAAAWAATCRLDSAAAAKRCAKATSDRHVSLRPAPEAMTYLTALLPLTQGVACYAALNAAANTAKATGDNRTRGQLMADLLVGRLTHPTTSHSPLPQTVQDSRLPRADAGPPAPAGRQNGAVEQHRADQTTSTAQPTRTPGEAAVSQTRSDQAPAQTDQPAQPDQASVHPDQEPAQLAGEVAFGDPWGVEVHLVVTDATLLGGDDTPALLTTAGPGGSNPAGDLIPAPVARDLVREAARAWVRRLYTHPESGQLVAMESTRRAFGGGLRRLVVYRDGHCRTPWCDAPIRHADHITPHAQGGPTSLTNAQGLCERCNQAKNLPGWSAHVLDQPDNRPGRHVVRTTTPTGRSYHSTAPPLLTTAPPETAPQHAAARSRPPGVDPQRLTRLAG